MVKMEIYISKYYNSLMKTEKDELEHKKSFRQLLEENPNLDEFMNNLRRTRFRRKAFDLLAQLFMISRLLFTPDGRRGLGDPYFKRALFQRKYRLGLLENAVIANNLYFPNEDNTSLENAQAAAGRYFGYDFRKREMGIKGLPRDQWGGGGRLMTVLPPEIRRNSPNQYTPTYCIDLLNFSDLIYLDAPKLADVIRDGLLRTTDYANAYQRVGLYEKYRQFIVLSGIENNIVYQVTPKGNGLVRLMTDGGEKVQKPKTHPAFKPAFQPF